MCAIVPGVTLVPVLEVGGTHVAAAMVDLDARSVRDIVRRPVDARADAEAIVDGYADAARTLAASGGACWGVAMPGPFDYARGVALFRGVGKYESLYGVDIGAGLAARLGGSFSFVNDADAFTLGEGVLRGVRHLVGITLGTGVGSGWVRDGHYTWDGPGVPPEGRINPNVEVGGRTLEEYFSIRAIRQAYRSLGGADLDVREIAAAARDGDPVAVAALQGATTVLGRVIGPRVRSFGAELLVVGGSIAGSWDVLGPWFAEAAGDLPPVVVSENTEQAGMLGAALVAVGG